MIIIRIWLLLVNNYTISLTFIIVGAITSYSAFYTNFQFLIHCINASYRFISKTIFLVYSGKQRHNW